MKLKRRAKPVGIIERSTFHVCVVCRHGERVEQKTPSRPCEVCGWELYEVALTMCRNHNTVSISWREDADGWFPEVEQALELADEMILREGEETSVLFDEPLVVKDVPPGIRRGFARQRARDAAKEQYNAAAPEEDDPDAP